MKVVSENQFSGKTYFYTFAPRIGKDVREKRTLGTDIYRADKRVSRYKTLDEQRAERRSYFSEKEIAIDAPTAPPR